MLLATERVLLSDMMVSGGANRRVVAVDRHAGVVSKSDALGRSKPATTYRDPSDPIRLYFLFSLIKRYFQRAINFPLTPPISILIVRIMYI